MAWWPPPPWPQCGWGWSPRSAAKPRSWARRVAAQQTQLASAQAQLAQGGAAEGSYTQNLTVVKQLYKAVPSTNGVPKLLVALDKTSNYKRVDFQVINVAPSARGDHHTGRRRHAGAFRSAC